MAEQQQPADGDVGAEGKPSKGGGKTFLVTIIAVILVAVGAGAAAAYLFFPQVTAMIDGTEQTAEDLADEEAEEPVEYGEFMELQGLMVNPAESMGRRHLMVSVGLEGADAKVLDAVGLREIVIRDRILGKLSSLTVEQLTDYALRDSIKTDMLLDINAILLEDEVEITRLYFTGFILQ